LPIRILEAGGYAQKYSDRCWGHGSLFRMILNKVQEKNLQFS
jgi:hypothetical protein